ncbi:uncharacterized protein MELLADRAFT_84171 [Melampsora larici-populina 98AG31]|uniref:Mediator of RNA polymerase II transcription subunit 7 n=1 Tax=Melampsora larici-populina (strain 98AG31 / pathotype 3-4-7) TaxID=747676 RepID=F4SBS2_MELLP|nr:uncharacterized protein MELLADRAFT_84171 [Melampsora larici-populina 98AG31]EGF97918.1 hypothetical protein MELLADRAFT_84171 [Melampsora larici-populina 98AG31]
MRINTFNSTINSKLSTLKLRAIMVLVTSRLEGIITKRIVPKLNRSSKNFNPKLQKQLIEENCQDLKEEVNEGIHFKTLIEPPNLDFIEERGGFTCFGDWETWPGKSSRAMLEGMPKLYEGNMVSKIDQIISHIKLTPFNMHGLCNEIRPRQTIEPLKLMLKEQAKEKRGKAQLVLQMI